MKILITGSKGMLAQAVIKRLNKHELVLTDTEELDITNESGVLKYIGNLKPEYIINCAAYTAVDKAEENETIAQKVNGDGPGNLAKAAKEVNATIIHISTDYVFDGELNVENEYFEDDKTEPVTIYGKTKLSGEQNIVKNTDKYYIFRTAWLYGEGNNFVRTMLKLGKVKEKLNVVADQHGSPTYTVDLANIVGHAIENNIPYGIYHSTNQGFTTWCDFTKKIFEYANIKCDVNPVTTEEYIKMMNIVQAKRPSNSKLNKAKLIETGFKIPTWEQSLERYLIEEKEI